MDFGTKKKAPTEHRSRLMICRYEKGTHTGQGRLGLSGAFIKSKPLRGIFLDCFQRKDYRAVEACPVGAAY